MSKCVSYLQTLYLSFTMVGNLYAIRFSLLTIQFEWRFLDNLPCSFYEIEISCVCVILPRLASTTS